ncbi:glycosyltransferase family 2 protein [Bacteroides oleiciplenus]|uniref:Glycosyltransferase family 2 protein n=1 Tax=Bacteroides oleiciplenus TaxID=626931 RepID=A0A3E5AY91_9BACE|nr:glycosyltransferase family 2 protein [Bacteroides oleiciplenus]RGN30321.1 glycosyltransferase family 2 protein [Bacteroides oleiciplenus]
MKTPLITLGIPIYNAADLIERTLLSAFDQTYPNIEYLLIDDKGNSMDVVRKVVAAHPRNSSVRIIDQIYNKGTGAARNAIVEHAKGEYLFTMDCDDVIIPDCIEILYKTMSEHPVDFVAASFVRRDLQGKIYPGGCQYSDILIDGEKHAVAQYRYGDGKNIFVATWNKLYRTAFLRENNIRCVPHYLIDDPWFTYQVIICAKSCHLISNCTLFFTYNPVSVTSIKEQEGYTYFLASQYLGTQKLKAEYIRLFTGYPFYMGALVDLMKMSLYHLYRTCSSSKITKEEKEEFLQGFLKRRFLYPRGWRLTDKNLYKALPLFVFYSLPMGMKKGIVRFLIKINLRRLLNRWIHF